MLSNAIKFTEKGGVSLQVKITETIGNKMAVNFRVIDTGIGIEAKNIEKIFHSFEQADINTTREYGGTGLGLTIVKQLVELQEGVVLVNSKVGVGTEFDITIPYFCLLYTSPSPRDKRQSRMPSSA